MDPNLVGRSFELLCDLQNELGSALASLAGKQSQGFRDNYYNLSAGHINRAAEGFIFLRKELRIDASKFLIRPAIEAMIRLEAVKRQPELLFRIAHTERIKDQKWRTRAAIRRGVTYDVVAEQKQWNEAKKKCVAQFGTHPLDERDLNLRDTAKEIDRNLNRRDTAKEIAKVMEDYYDDYYLMYSAYTHAALGALTGSLNELTDPEDSATMGLCVFSALDIVATIGASTPNLESLRERRDKLHAVP
jgi:uncharacterized protein DUF5677